MTRFKIKHPEVTPELYILNSKDKRSENTKGLIKSDDFQSTIKGVYGHPDDALDEYFDKSARIEKILLHKSYHMYADSLSVLDESSINIIATRLYRYCCLTNLGRLSKEVIHGPVLIYGSAPISQKKLSHENYSAPYEVIEQVYRLHENYCYEF